MLRYECFPVLLGWFLDVYVDETVSRSVQIGVESEYSSLIGDIGVLGVKVVHEFDPWQQAWRRTFIKLQDKFNKDIQLNYKRCISETQGLNTPPTLTTEIWFPA